MEATDLRGQLLRAATRICRAALYTMCVAVTAAAFLCLLVADTTKEAGAQETTGGVPRPVLPVR